MSNYEYRPEDIDLSGYPSIPRLFLPSLHIYESEPSFDYLHDRLRRMWYFVSSMREEVNDPMFLGTDPEYWEHGLTEFHLRLSDYDLHPRNPKDCPTCRRLDVDVFLPGNACIALSNVYQAGLLWSDLLQSKWWVKCDTYPSAEVMAEMVRMNIGEVTQGAFRTLVDDPSNHTLAIRYLQKHWDSFIARIDPGMTMFLAYLAVQAGSQPTCDVVQRIRLEEPSQDEIARAREILN